jgi:hypothetical protein
MKRKILLLCACSFMLTIAPLPTTDAQSQYGSRAYYSNGKVTNRWIRYRQGDYYGTYFKYKPTPQATQYQHHMAYYFPKKGNYVYYYNPQTKKYWGRCPFNPTRENPYQILNWADQHEKLDYVKESAFTKVTPNLKVTLYADGGPREYVVNPSPNGMPPLPGTLGQADPEPMPPPPPAPERAGWDWSS